MLDFSSTASSNTYRDCPICGYKQSFKITVKDGKQLFKCHAGCSQGDILAAIRGNKRIAFPQCMPTQKECADVRQYARQLWENSVLATGTLADAYLKSRSLDGNIPASIRFLPNHSHKPSGKRLPVMLASVTDTLGRLQAIHRTYLAPDGIGKAQVEPPRMTLGGVAGFAIHLAPISQILAITEGIETGMSVMQATGLPTWAALSAGNFHKLILPPLPLAAEVVICADNDRNGCGQRAARNAAMRWQREGRSVRIAYPPSGMDFNDLLKTGNPVLTEGAQ